MKMVNKNKLEAVLKEGFIQWPGRRKDVSIDMQGHLSFRLTVFPANLTFETASN